MTCKSNPKTRVCFRHFAGELVALFPDMRETQSGWLRNNLCSCYAHIGQHGIAMDRLGRPCRNASEYAPLLAELQNIGYDLQVLPSWPRKYR